MANQQLRCLQQAFILSIAEPNVSFGHIDMPFQALLPSLTLTASAKAPQMQTSGSLAHCLWEIEQGNDLLSYSPRDPCAALAAYFLCTGLRIIE